MRKTLTLLILFAFSDHATANEHGRRMRQAAEDAVRYLLRDPDSASFRDVAIRENPRAQDSQYIEFHVCGSVNSRNGYGGMAGFTNFVYSAVYSLHINEIIVPSITLNEGEDRRRFEEHWQRSCAGQLPVSRFGAPSSMDPVPGSQNCLARPTPEEQLACHRAQFLEFTGRGSATGASNGGAPVIAPIPARRPSAADNSLR